MPAFGKLRQVDCCELEGSLGSIVRYGPTWARVKPCLKTTTAKGLTKTKEREKIPMIKIKSWREDIAKAPWTQSRQGRMNNCTPRPENRTTEKELTVLYVRRIQHGMGNRDSPTSTTQVCICGFKKKSPSDWGGSSVSRALASDAQSPWSTPRTT